jgi:hypothetical protein
VLSGKKEVIMMPYESSTVGMDIMTKNEKVRAHYMTRVHNG